MSSSLAALTADDFERPDDKTYLLAGPTGEIELRLVEIRRLGTSRREGGAFALTFLAPAGPFLPQKIYSIANGALGTLSLFIVPIGPMQGGNGYEAVFT
jgi:hypothetical protein